MMMKNTLNVLSIALVGMLCLLSMHGQTQTQLKGKLGYHTGYHSNVFNSPDSYVTPTKTYSSTELIESSILHDANGAVELTQKKPKYAWSIGSRVWYRALPQAKNGNQSALLLKGTYKYRKPKTWDLANTLSFKRENKLGLNVLGEELLKSFSYFSLRDKLTYTWSKNDQHKSAVYLGGTYQHYDAVTAQEALTHVQWQMGYQATQTFKNPKGLKRQVVLDARYRQRNYLEWSNTELLKTNVLLTDESPFLPFDSNAVYPHRIWKYQQVQLTYVHFITKDSKIKPYVDFTRRLDASQGDFGYNNWEYGVRAYAKLEGWDLNFKFGYSNRKYTDRLAEQQSGTPYPLLHYQYIRAKANVEFSLSKSLRGFVEFQTVQRLSNTTNIEKRTRRNYVNSIALAGVSYNFKRKLKK